MSPVLGCTFRLLIALTAAHASHSREPRQDPEDPGYIGMLEMPEADASTAESDTAATPADALPPVEPPSDACLREDTEPWSQANGVPASGTCDDVRAQVQRRFLPPKSSWTCTMPGRIVKRLRWRRAQTRACRITCQQTSQTTTARNTFLFTWNRQDTVWKARRTAFTNWMDGSARWRRRTGPVCAVPTPRWSSTLRRPESSMPPS